MGQMIRLTGILLWTRWPILLAWFLFGILVRYVAIEIAGFAGAYNETIGVLLLPLTVLGRLVALVAMFLVLRDGMSALRGDIPQDRATRRGNLRMHCSREFFRLSRSTPLADISLKTSSRITTGF